MQVPFCATRAGVRRGRGRALLQGQREVEALDGLEESCRGRESEANWAARVGEGHRHRSAGAERGNGEEVQGQGGAASGSPFVRLFRLHAQTCGDVGRCKSGLRVLQ